MARASSPNAVAFVAARAQASDRLLPKLRPLELSSTALEPRRARGQIGAEHRGAAAGGSCGAMLAPKRNPVFRMHMRACQPAIQWQRIQLQQTAVGS